MAAPGAGAGTARRYELPLRVTAKTDYAVRAMAELAASGGDRLVKAEHLAQAQRIPLKFLLNIMTELRHARIVRSHRGSEGGYQLARSPREITLAEVITAVQGSLATVQSQPADELSYSGAAATLGDVWLAVQGAMQSVLGTTTLADLVDRSVDGGRV